MTRGVPRLQPGLWDELIVDNFAGGGGASLGIEWGLGRGVDIAINHDREAVEMHKANHPWTKHYTEDVWDVDPVKVCKGRSVGLAWFSPDCKHFSKAKGGQPVSRKIRGLAWVAVKWGKKKSPRVIMLENVEEFQDWGPLIHVCDSDGKPKFDSEGRPVMMPCGVNKGKTFYLWVHRLEQLGYKVDWRELRACDYGAPTIRKRLFLIARRDGLPIVWPDPTHGDPKSEEVKSGKLQPWKTAADCIDWSIPCHSIFLTKEEARAVGVKRPLADATMRRIAKGVMRYVIESLEPFVVTYYGDKGGEFRGSRSANRWLLRLRQTAIPWLFRFLPSMRTLLRRDVCQRMSRCGLSARTSKAGTMPLSRLFSQSTIPGLSAQMCESQLVQ